MRVRLGCKVNVDVVVSVKETKLVSRVSPLVVLMETHKTSI